MPAAESGPAKVHAGRLLVVATPLGNLGDVSQRAREALGQADLVACEDTRTTGNLLKLLGIEGPRLIAYHEHNEKEAAQQIAEKVRQGLTVALVSDAGTPGVSDPGFRVVRECQRLGLEASPIPGPCAALALLSVSGLPTNAFRFVGFLQPKSAARRRFLAEEAAEAEETLVLHESCHRIEALLTEMLELLGPDRVACVGREITKAHETVRTGALGRLVPEILAGSLKGEFTLAVAPKGFVL
ncbi:MAG: 16S rRNA (cytidine(1402)-2'-O)-methyltransferase [Opitutia bacterium]